MDRQIRGIACDFGNVNGSFDHGLAVNGFAGICEMSPTEIHDAVFNSPLEERYDCGLPTVEFLIELRERLQIDGSVPDERLKRIWQNIFIRTEENERVIDTLRRVSSDVRIVLASNTNELHFEEIERRWADLLSWLDDIVVSHRVGHRKPAWQFYDAVLAALGTAPEETLFIDDRADLVAAAVELGLTGLQYTPGLDLAACLAERRILLDGDRSSPC